MSQGSKFAYLQFDGDYFQGGNFASRPSLMAPEVKFLTLEVTTV
jgi:hypothetical protein